MNILPFLRPRDVYFSEQMMFDDLGEKMKMDIKKHVFKFILILFTPIYIYILPKNHLFFPFGGCFFKKIYTLYFAEHAFLKTPAV